MVDFAFIQTTVLQTIVPLLLLMGMGSFSRKIRVLKSGDEQVLSTYIYYFALPALFFVNMAEMTFSEETFRFILASITPIFAALSTYIIIARILKMPREMFYLTTLSTVFGSLAFFGIPFIMFAFPTSEAEFLATLSAASVSIIGVTISITMLELFQLEERSRWDGLKQVLRRLLKNPLIISISSGILLSLFGIVIPAPISTSLHMVGRTTSTVAIFMLGAVLYGRKYTNLRNAFKLSLLRIVFLPLVALLISTLFFLSEVETAIVVLMHSMPVAVSMMILSERYNFKKETVASVILISSLGAGIYLNLWLLVLSSLWSY